MSSDNAQSQGKFSADFFANNRVFSLWDFAPGYYFGLLSSLVSKLESFLRGSTQFKDNVDKCDDRVSCEKNPRHIERYVYEDEIIKTVFFLDIFHDRNLFS